MGVAAIARAQIGIDISDTQIEAEDIPRQRERPVRVIGGRGLGEGAVADVTGSGQLERQRHVDDTGDVVGVADPTEEIRRPVELTTHIDDAEIVIGAEGRFDIVVGS